MRSKILLLLCLLCCTAAPYGAAAQDGGNAKIPRVLFLLDGSSSMSEKWANDRERFEEAGKFILKLIDSLSGANEQVEFGLRVFGHQYPAQDKNCFDTKLEVKFSHYNVSQMQARLESLRGYGVSPIAFSLSEAAHEDFENEKKYAYSIILITDGGESCGGDICNVVSELLQKKIFFRPYIVSLLDYAPLKDQYKCLGTYLTVANEAQETPAITKIVDAHREGFDRAKTGKVIPVFEKVNKPDTLVVPIKKETPAVLPKDTIKPAPKKEETPKPVLQVRDSRKIKMLRLNTRLRVYKTIVIDPPMPRMLSVPPFRMSEIGDAPVPPPRPKISTVKGLKLSKIKNYNRGIDVLPFPNALKVPPMVLSKFEPQTTPPAPEKTAVNADTIVIPIKIKKTPGENTTVVRTNNNPGTPPKPKVKEESKYKIEKTASAETEVEVFFTDGNGKYYSSTPQILLSDPSSGKELKKFYRSVDASNNPDPIKVNPGTYNLSVVGSDKTFLRNVEISPNTKNRIEIVVASGSLQFVWEGFKNKTPVGKYLAQVKRNFVAQPMVTQRCDTILQYPPGNYHIEINTMPATVLSVDLVFGAMIVIEIKEPGTVRFSNTGNMGKVDLYYSLGDRFVKFHQLYVNGNPGSQSVELKPGVYEAHYKMGTGLPDKVTKFYIKSNETNIIELL